MSVFLLVLIIIAPALAARTVLIYNGLVQLKHNTAKAWSNIDVLLKQRHDELPKLVETCRQHTQFEQATLEKVIAARGQVQQARERGAVRKRRCVQVSAASSPSPRPTRNSGQTPRSRICSIASPDSRTPSRTAASSTTSPSISTTCAANNSPTTSS